jgi:hypothetical protein
VTTGGWLMDVLGGAASATVASDAYGRFERWCSSSLVEPCLLRCSRMLCVCGLLRSYRHRLGGLGGPKRDF